MPVLADDIYEIASRLGFANPPIECNEASARSALSRGYYAAFHSTISAFKIARKVEVFDPGHEPWCNWLSGIRDPRAKGIGTTLNELRQLRVDADYKITEIMKKGLLAHLRDAKDIMARNSDLIACIKADKRLAPPRRHA